MSGIVGILNFNHQPVLRDQLKAMTDILKHRGPDGEGHYIDGHVGLGHRQLATVDLNRADTQPLNTSDGRFTITYNGTIYNLINLQRELKARGYQFHSQTAAETILNAYTEWGPQCVKRFNGMFALAIWDTKKQQLFLARDRYGIKPLYYHIGHKGFVFASENKAIFVSGLYPHPILDKVGLVEYLTFQNFFTDRTLFQDIQLLMPGHYAILDAGHCLKKTIYWDFDFNTPLKISEAEAIEETDRLFQQAVQRQLIGHIPVNAYLSGGIDSGAITMVASRILPSMKTFTIGFDLSSASGLELSFDERTKAEHISYLAKTEHYEMVLKAGDMERCMDKYVWHLEEPRVGQSYPNYYAAKLASKFGKIVLTGAGGDELFGGYPWRYFHTDHPIMFDDFIDQYYIKWQRLLPNKVLRELLAPIWEDVQHVWTRDIFADVFGTIVKERLTPTECLNHSFYLEAKTFLHGLLVVEDKLSMAHGLETRAPFLDNDLVDFAMKIPASFKVKKKVVQVDENDLASKNKAYWSGKNILRKTLERYLDKSVTQYKKQGFSSPDASWFRGESIEYVKTALTPASMPTTLFNTSIIEQILQKHITGEQNYRLAIWSLLHLKKLQDIF